MELIAERTGNNAYRVGYEGKPLKEFFVRSKGEEFEVIVLTKAYSEWRNSPLEESVACVETLREADALARGCALDYFDRLGEHSPQCMQRLNSIE